MNGISKNKLVFLAFSLLMACGSNELSLLQADDSTSIEARDPYLETPNDGIFNGISMRQMEQQGVGEIIGTDNAARREFRSVVIQQIEIDKSEKQKNSILFGIGHYYYLSPFQIEHKLVKYQLQYLALDANGKLAEMEAWSITYEQGDNGWKKSLEKIDLNQFYRNLPSWAKTKLWQVSGALSANSGEIIQYEPTDIEILMDIIELIPLPSAKAGPLVDHIIGIISGKGTEGARSLSKAGKLRVGIAFDVEDESAKTYAEKYIDQAKPVWEKAFQ